jgi:hypothetical protein
MYNRVTCHLAAGLPLQVSIVGAKALVQKGSKTADAPSTTSMIGHVLHGALKEAQLDIQDVDGLIAVPSLKENHFMESHYQATLLGMFSPDRPLRCRTIDTGGAGPVSALLEAERMIKNEMPECVAVVAADSVFGPVVSERSMYRHTLFALLESSTFTVKQALEPNIGKLRISLRTRSPRTQITHFSQPE